MSRALVDHPSAVKVDTSDQVPTRNVTTAKIMASPEFERGLDEVRKGIAFDWRNGDWSYERGRHIAPLTMLLRGVRAASWQRSRSKPLTDLHMDFVGDLALSPP